MKKTTLLLFLLASIGRVYAQSFNFGIAGGYDKSGVYATGVSRTVFTNMAGFNAGVFSDYNWKNITLESGLYFTTKGYYSNTYLINFINPDQAYSVRATGKLSLNYLEIPLNLLYNFHVPFGGWFIGGGAFFDYALSGQSNGTAIESSYPGGNTTAALAISNPVGGGSDEFKKTNTGFEATTGIRFKHRLIIAFKIQNSFGNIFDNDPQTIYQGMKYSEGSQSFYQGSLKSAGYSISAGYMFL
jgi:hypothetical protein